MPHERKYGNEITLEILFALYGDDVYRAAYFVLQDAFLAEDATQETFITAYEKLSGLRNPKKLKAWLIRIAMNKAIDLLRKQRRSVPLEDIDKYLKAGQQTDPASQIASGETLLTIEEVISGLPAGFQTVFFLRYYSKFTVQQIATFMNIPENTVKSRIKKIKRAVAAHLKKAAHHCETSVPEKNDLKREIRQ